MKFCPHCNRWNLGTPQRCRYCGRTWGERICSAGHPNPADANFCGECGRAELSEPAGRTPFFIRAFSLIKPIGVGLIIITAISLFVGLLEAVFRSDPAAVVLPVTFLVIAFSLASRFLRINVLKLTIRIIRNVFRSR
jgi:hypothetical protein